MELIAMEKKLKETLSERRYNHSLGVMETAVKLAEQYGADVEKARLSGLLHDCAKDIDKAMMPEMCEALGVPLDSVKLTHRSLIHADLGARLAETEYGVTDGEVLDAIRYHTLGRPDMTLLEKILYLADFIEPTRKEFPALSELRRLSVIDLDLATLRALESCIAHVKSQGKDVHKQSLDTLEFYQKLVEEKERVMI